MSAAIEPAKKAFRRLAPADRRRQIVDAAVAYFSEFGFEGATRGLADRLGVTQPLIYRYFPSKDELIRAVYEEVYLSRWRGEWIELLGRREAPLRERLVAFYAHYTGVIFEPQWMRIYLFSGLRGLDINRWWISFVEDHVLRTICEEVRVFAGLPGAAEIPITAAEIDGYWLFHGGIFYYGMRENVYGVAPRTPLPHFIEMSIDSFLQGFPETVKRALA
ncbi:TetR/AcrR family transcriptional regulator [uncultured Enterovirga sp.]|uniref:TetR/AcrR family transcriptional regulator n=1 Tax=uncultured Enterovirga sp. TaxID=2026352 RepID=UPI0035CB3D92